MDFVDPYDESIPVFKREAWVREQSLEALKDCAIVADMLVESGVLPLQEMANVNSRCVTLAKAFKMLERLGGRNWDDFSMLMFSEDGKAHRVKVIDLIQTDQDALEPDAVLYPREE